MKRNLIDDLPAANQASVDAFVTLHTSPLIGEREAIIWYCGPGERIVLRGDMLQERSAPLTRLGSTDLWFHHGTYEADARLDYHLLVNEQDIGDPRNPRRAPSGYGPRAELRMPHYAAPDPWRWRDVPRGSLTRYNGVRSATYPSTRTVWVYTPPAYDRSRAYPSVYFHDGGDYLRFAHAPNVLDNLIHDGTLPPCVAVFVEPSAHGRVAEYDRNDAYVRFVCDELVPWIDRHYCTRSDPVQRAILGASFGGLIALWIAHQRPDRFGLVGSQSGFVSRANDAVIELYRQGPLPRCVDLLVGTYETHVGPFERGTAEADFLAGNRRLRDLLQTQPIRQRYAEYHEGHAWGLWRARLGETLIFLLSDPS